jgi:hypothetical protein
VDTGISAMKRANSSLDQGFDTTDPKKGSCLGLSFTALNFTRNISSNNTAQDPWEQI